jgi:hypothetical protein
MPTVSAAFGDAFFSATVPDTRVPQSPGDRDRAASLSREAVETDSAWNTWYVVGSSPLATATQDGSAGVSGRPRRALDALAHAVLGGAAEGEELLDLLAHDTGR